MVLGAYSAMVLVAVGFAMALIRSVQDINVLAMESVESFQLAIVSLGIVSICVIFALGELASKMPIFGQGSLLYWFTLFAILYLPRKTW